MAVNLHTTHYRFGVNSGTESTHGWHDNLDASPVDIITPGTTFLLRFTVQETGGTAAANVDQQFQYSKNGGAYTNITASSNNVRAVATSVFANGANLTKRLTGTGTFETTAAGGTHDGLSGGNNNDIASLGNSETECALQLVATDVAHGDFIQFRLTSPDFTITNDVIPGLAVRSHGVVATSAAGTLVKMLSIALVGLSIAASQGTMTASGSEGATLLTGEAITGAAGTVVQSQSAPLTGIQLTGAQGSIVAGGRSLIQSSQGTAVPNISLTLAGDSLTIAQGLVMPEQGGTIGPLTIGPLNGLTITSAQGSVTTPNDIPMTGQAMTSASGTLAMTLRPTDIVGQSIVSAHGIMTILDTPVTVHLGGEEITSAQGFVDATTILAGQAITSETGTLTPSAEMPLVGIGMAFGQSGVAVGQDPDDTKIISGQGYVSAIASVVPLVGTAISLAQGTIGVTYDAAFELTGIASVGTAGTATANVAVPLLGASITTAPGTLGAPGGATLTGEAMTASQGTIYTDGDRTRVLTGAEITATQGALGVNVLVHIGGNVTVHLGWGNLPWGDRWGGYDTLQGGISITSGLGTLSISKSATRALTGQSVTVARGTILPLANRTFMLSGQSLTAQQGLVFANNAGSVQLIGQALTGQQGSVIAPNVVALTGLEITSVQGSVSHPELKSFDLSGELIVTQQGNMLASVDEPDPDTSHGANEGCGVAEGPANEGCGSISGAANTEGCGTAGHAANEERV